MWKWIEHNIFNHVITAISSVSTTIEKERNVSYFKILYTKTGQLKEFNALPVWPDISSQISPKSGRTVH